MTTITGLVADQATTDQNVIKPFLGVTITGSGSFTVQVKLSSPQFAAAPKIGTLSNLGGGTYVRSTGVYTINGTADQITTALDGLVFTPAVSQVAAGQTVAAAFTMSAPADPTFSATSNLVITDIGFSTLLNSSASALATDGAGDLFGQTSAGGLFELPNTGGVYASTTTALPTVGGAVTGFAVDIAGDVYFSTSAGELALITPSSSGYHVSSELHQLHTGNGDTFVGQIAGTSWGGMFVVDETHSDELRFFGLDTGHFSPGAIPPNTAGESIPLGITGVVGQVVADRYMFDAYGTTGAVNGSLGSLFDVHDLSPGSTQITTLATFTGANGADPRSGVTIDGAGELFGTTFSGGAYGLGTVFEYDFGSQQLITLASFNGANGANPVGGLVIDGDGNLWGTTSAGGAANDGTVFEIATTGVLTVPGPAGGGPAGGPTWSYATAPTTIVTFTGSNGAAPLAGLTFDNQGHLFGSTSAGGSSNAGTVFEIANAGFVPPPPLTIYLLNALSPDEITPDADFTGIGYHLATVHFTVDGTALTTTATSGPDGSWIYSIPGLADGLHTVVASETDPLGYGSPISASLTFTLDTPPAVTVRLANDTGIAGDRITSDDTLSGTGDPNAVVQFTVDSLGIAATTTADASGNWTFAPTGLSHGPHTVVASETDFAGITGSAALTFTLDTPPAVTVGLANDTGIAGDLITSDDTLSGGGDALAVVHFTVDGVDIAATTTADPSGNWTFAPAGLSDGSHTVVASERDAAGSTGSASVAFTLDTTAPATSVSLAHDTGASSADGITSDGTLSGTGDPNAVVQLNIDGAAATTVADASGNWTFAPTGLGDGPHTVTVSETDAAGNTGSASVAFTLDTAAPAMSVSLAHDTGASSADGITSDDTLTGSGDPNAVVQFNIDGAAATAVADASGNWTFVPAGLGDGPHTATVSETDAAGNTASASVAFTLDTTAPTMSVSLAHDTGTSVSDGISSDDALTGSGDPNAVVQLNIDGAATTTVADASGNWTFAPAGLGDGPHAVTASETDAAGNIGSASVAFTLDTVAPATSVSLAHDTGASSADGITSDDTLSGTGDPNAVVQLNIDGAAATTVADASGNWTFAPAGLGDGPHTATVSETDAAGNTASASLAFRLDTVAPAVTIGLAHDTGASSTDRITSDDTFTGSGDPNAVVRFNVDGVDIAATTTADPFGNWTFVPMSLAAGPHTVVASETDAAGNTGSASLAFTLVAASGPAAGNAHLYANAAQSVDLTSFLLAQDSAGSGGGTLSIGAVNTAGTHGTVSLINGKLTYTAPASGSSDAFTYMVSDQFNDTATGSVNVSLVAKNASIALSGSGNDVVLGSGNYSITGGAGGNAVTLGSGNDSVSLAGNKNTVVLGSGNDSVSLLGDNNSVTLGNGNHSVATGASSTITLGNGNDTVSSGANSTIVVGNGNDTITAGANTKVTVGNGNDFIYAGANDAITLGKGHDTIAFGVSPSPLAIGNETVTNFAKGDVLEFNHALILNYAAAMSDSRQVGQDTVITVDSHDTVTLQGTAMSSLTASAFKFV